jgi:hypothetical protein
MPYDKATFSRSENDQGSHSPPKRRELAHGRKACEYSPKAKFQDFLRHTVTQNRFAFAALRSGSLLTRAHILTDIKARSAHRFDWCFFCFLQHLSPFSISL